MDKPDYNIEFAHIYADEEFSNEQIKSIEILKKVILKLKNENKTFVISLLIDEFHSATFSLDKQKIIDEFKSRGIEVDFIGYESKLGSIADQLVKEIPSQLLKFEHFHKPEKEVLMLEDPKGEFGLEEKFEFMYRHTCALLSASWSLCRLGVFKIPEDAIENFTNKTFDANKLITILPEKYRGVENRVLEIIQITKFKDVINNIEYEFF